MSKNVKIAIGAALAVLCVMIVWVVATLPTPPSGDGTIPQKIVKHENNTISEEKDGKVKWTLTADNIDMNLDTQKATLTNIKGMFYTDDGRTVKLDAKTGEYDQNKHDFALKGGVICESSDGAVVSAEKAEWRQKDSTLELIGKAHLEKKSDGLKADADKIESSNGFSKFKAVGHAHIEKGN